MEINIGFWQVLELFYVSYILMKNYSHHGELIFSKDLIAAVEKANKADYFTKSIANMFAKIIAGAYVMFWVMVAVFGGCEGIGLAGYAVLMGSLFAWAATRKDKNMQDVKRDFSRTLTIQVIGQMLLLYGGFYTTGTFAGIGM